MFGKLLIIIVAFGLTSSKLLVLRQQRLDEAHRISMLHQQILEREAELWRIRGEIARLTHPAAVRELLAQHPNTNWSPLPPIDPRPAPDERLR